MKDLPVIFMVGSMRSGTSMLRLMLDHHPEIAFNLESEYLVSQISDDGSFPEITHYQNWLAHDRVFQHSKFSVNKNLDFISLVNDFLVQKKSRDNKRLVGATIHHDFSKLHLIWPKAKYIYVLRDGRDVANSVVRMGWAGNVYMAASWWKKAEDEWVICKKHLASDAWMEVRYEELVTNPTNTLTAICSFIGVAYSTRMLDYIQGSTYEAPDKNLSFQWRTRMTKENIQLLESRIGDRLISRGYELSKHPKIALSFWTKIYLKCQSRFRMITFRFERFGILLTIVEILSRKLGVKKIHNIAIKKGSEIQDNYLK